MIYPVHHLPGRLRIRSPLAKGDPRAAAALCGRIRAIAGVRLVEVNPLTGGAVIEYCRDTVTGLGILRQLDGQRYGADYELRLTPRFEAPMADKLAHKLLGAVTQTLVEHSVAALI